VYYWYGENKEKTDKAAGIWHWGVRYYASTDLYNWEDRGLLIPPVTDDPNSSLHPTSMMDLKILFDLGHLLIYHCEGKTAPTWYECG